MEKEKKQKLIKILEGVGYGLIMLIMLCWAFACGYKQSRDLDYLKNTVSEIRENQEKQEEITSNLLDNRPDNKINAYTSTKYTFQVGYYTLPEYITPFTSNEIGNSSGAGFAPTFKSGEDYGTTYNGFYIWKTGESSLYYPMAFYNPDNSHYLAICDVNLKVKDEYRYIKVETQQEKTIDASNATRGQYMADYFANLLTYSSTDPRPSEPIDPPIEDLNGSTWYFNSDVLLNTSTDYDINFSSNNHNYSYLGIDIEETTHSLYYNTTAVYSYTSSGGGGSNLRLKSNVGSWIDSNYRLITFTGGEDTDSSALIDFMYANAQLLTYNPPSEPEPEPEPVLNPYNLNARYDFRKWYGDVDPLTGCIHYTWGTGDNNKIYDIGLIVVGGVEYNYLRVSLLSVNNSINIITGYDYQNQCYLAMGGGDYYASSGNYSLILNIELLNADTVAQSSQRLNLYTCPLVGARLKYDSGNPLSPDDYTPATGYLCATFELAETGINWEDYQPSNTKYNFNGIGNNLSVYEVLQLDLLNDTYMDFYSVSASASGGNVFDLITNAFKALGPILSIQLIPGLPIGLLVILPLVATILIVVIKLVRK